MWYSVRNAHARTCALLEAGSDAGPKRDPTRASPKPEAGSAVGPKRDSISGAGSAAGRKRNCISGAGFGLSLSATVHM